MKRYEAAGAELQADLGTRPKQAVIFLTHHASRRVYGHFERLRRDLLGVMPTYLAFHRPQAGAADPPFVPDITISAADAASMFPTRYNAMIRQQEDYFLFIDLAYLPAFAHPMFSEFDFLWMIEEDVDFSGDWGELFEGAAASTADLIGSHFARRSQSSAWMHWSTFSSPVSVSPEVVTRGLFPLVRFSRRFLETYQRAVSDPAWVGNFEALYPTVAAHHGLNIATLTPVEPGSGVPSLKGSHTPDKSDVGDIFTFNSGATVSDSYFHETPENFPQKNRLYHPVKVELDASRRYEIRNKVASSPVIVEAAALVLNHLVLVGRTSGDEVLTAVEIVSESSRVAAPIVAYCGFESDHRPSTVGEIGQYGFIVACHLGADDAKHLARQTEAVSLKLMSRSDLIFDGSVFARTLLDLSIVRYYSAVRLLCEEMAATNPEFARTVASAVDGGQARPTLDCEIVEHIVVPDWGFVVVGRMGNLRASNVAFILDDLRLAVSPDKVFPLEGNEFGDAAGQRFACLEAIEGDSHTLRLAAVSSSGVSWSREIELWKTGVARAALRIVARFVRPGALMWRPSAASILHRLLDRCAPPEPSVQVVEFKAAETPVDLSIIVPFFRESFFLVDHLRSQRRTNANAEWLFVCDDPTLLESMSDICRSSRRDTMKPTRLVALGENVGFAKANNVAVRFATSDYVLFMNSDVYWRSFAPIERGVEILRSEPTVGMVGFALHYEDGSLQHAGMHFVVPPEQGEVFRGIHDGKGLPWKEMDSEISVRDVDGATGALILVRRSDFDGPVFDERFIAGDCEDGDLCLRVRQAGRRIVLIECAGLFHLERQSIGTDETHRFLSYMNSARFAAKWRHEG